MKININKFFLIVCFLLIPNISSAVITFTNGKWETTFNCPEAVIDVGSDVNCDGMAIHTDSDASDGSHTLITSAANYSSGGGGRGVSRIAGYGQKGSYGVGTNDASETLKVDMPSPQKELWIRFYIKYPANWGVDFFGYDKIMYLYTAGYPNGQMPILEPNGTGFRITCQGAATQTCSGTQSTWKLTTDMMGGNVGDNVWHSIEYHIKMDTDGTDGIAEVWVDGVRRVHSTSVDYSQGITAARAGIAYVAFNINQNHIINVNNEMARVFYDDIVIYNTTPPNTDSYGNPYIGPLRSVPSQVPSPINGVCGSASGQSFTSLNSGSPNLCATGTVAPFAGTGPWTWGCSGSNGGTSTSSTACSASLASPSLTSLLFSESFEDNNYSARGWYDTTNHGTIATSGCYSGNCLQWSWLQAATKPVNGGAMRKAFTATDSLFVSFYVKFQTGWQGSQKTYHPHMIYILSDLDAAYSSLARSYLNTYIEFLSDIGSPYTIRPQIELQDALRVNSSNGTPPVDLRSVTENRSVTRCNTPVSSGGGASVTGNCWNDGSWETETNYLASGASVSTNTWHKVEVFFKMNTVTNSKGNFDGVMQEWIDGVKVIDRSDILYRTNQDATKKWAQFVLAPYIGDGSPIAQTMWIDSLEVYTNLPSSATPATPKSLQIINITK